MGLQVGGEAERRGDRGIPGWADVVNPVEGDSNKMPSVPAEEKLSKETMAFASISIWLKAAPPVITSKPDNSVLPHLSLVPFELLPQQWSSD